MRVCDITKLDDVKTRYVLLEVPLDYVLTDNEDDVTRVVHDLEVGSRAAEALEAKNWRELNSLTPWQERPKDEKRSQGAKKAGETRRKNREAQRVRAQEAAARMAQEGGETE